MTRERIVIAGSGAFGTALAAVAALSDKADVILLCRNPDQLGVIQATGSNERHLPGIVLPSNLAYSADPTVLRGASTVLLVMPSQAQRDAAISLRSHLAKGASIVTCAKGIERATGRLLSDVLADVLTDHPISVLSGPGFAADIARGLPTAMVIASATMAEAECIARLISGKTFRLYPATDRIGVQLGGALKNVLAIAAGIVEGAGLGESARAALIARGLAEMSRLVIAMGGRDTTVRGLSGLGDLVLTATSRQSRNFRFGVNLGLTGTLPAADSELVEGIHAASIGCRLAHEHHIEMPVTDAVSAIIDGRLDVRSAIAGLMSRPITTE